MTRKSFNKLLHEMHKPKEVKTSIVEDIDNACANGITESRNLSLRDMRKSLNNLTDMLTDFDRGKFFPSFFRLYSSIMAPPSRTYGVFHPSQLMTACERAMYYELCNTPASDVISKSVSGALQRTFDVGTWYHVYIQNILYQIGIMEQAEAPVVDEKRYICGSADGILKKEIFGERVLLEIKTMNSFSFKGAIFKPYVKHEFQASLYADVLGINKILYLYINKDTSEMKDFLVPKNEEQLVAARGIIDRVIGYKDSKHTAPPRSCKTCENKVANSCPFKTLCFSTTD